MYKSHDRCSIDVLDDRDSAVKIKVVVDRKQTITPSIVKEQQHFFWVWKKDFYVSIPILGYACFNLLGSAVGSVVLLVSSPITSLLTVVVSFLSSEGHQILITGFITVFSRTCKKKFWLFFDSYRARHYEWVRGGFAPGGFASRRFALEDSPLGDLPPRKICPQKIRPQRIRPQHRDSFCVSQLLPGLFV